MRALKGDQAGFSLADYELSGVGHAAPALTLTGTAGAETLTGGAGADSLNGKAGDDLITGGDGADTLDGGEIDPTQNHNSDGWAEPGNDTINGGAGADWINGSYGDDVVSGDAGNDTVFGGFGKDVVHGGDGADILYANGIQTADYMMPSGVDGDQLFGDEGDDILILDEPGKTGIGQGWGTELVRDTVHVDGGAGYDELRLADWANVYLDQAAPADTIRTVEAAGIERITASEEIGVPRATEVFGSAASERLVLTGVDWFHGGAGDDTMTSTGNMDGGLGNDRMIGTRAGYEVLAGPGNDYIDAPHDALSYTDATAGVTVDMNVRTAQDTGGGGIDTIAAGMYRLTGSNFADKLTDIFSGSEVLGMGGDDTLIAGGGPSGLEGGDGRDLLIGSAANENGLDGGAGADTLTGGADVDFLTGDDGADKLTAGAGDDFLWGGAGNDRLDGGAGSDWVEFASATRAVTLDLSLTTAQQTEFGRDVYISIERVLGSGFGDRFTGSTGDDSLTGALGDDLLSGGGGADTLLGGAENDTVRGGDGDDLLSGRVVNGGGGVDTLVLTGGGTIDLEITKAQQVRDGVTMQVSFVENVTGGGTVYGTEGANRLEGGLLFGRGGDDVLAGGASGHFDGGDGFDTADLTASYQAVVLTSNTGFFSSIEKLVGSSFADSIDGAARFGTIDGGAGADTLASGAATATLLGGDGDDLLRLNALGGKVDGGAGLDTLDLSLAQASLVDLSGVTGAQPNNAQLTVAGVEAVIGSKFADTILGGDAAETLNGADREDRLSGGGGADSLIGGDGDDTLVGGLGNDTLAGGAGVDVVDCSAATKAVNLGLADGAHTIAGLGSDIFSGIEGLIGSRFADTLTGSAGNDVLAGGLGNDTLNTGGGQDKIVFHAGDGQDVVIGFTGGDVIDLRDYARHGSLQQVGADTRVVLSDTDSILLKGVQASSLTDANFIYYQDPSVGLKLIGGDAADVLTGKAGADTIQGGGGDDTIQGGGGDDFINGGAGRNHIDGGDGNDTLDYSTCAIFSGSLVEGGAMGHVGHTTVDYIDVFTSVENVIGAFGTTVIIGNDVANRFTSFDGRDTLQGGGGDDTLSAGAGANKITGDAGFDLVDYGWVSSGITIDLTVTTAQATSGGGSDVLATIEGLRGGGFNDTLSGDGQANLLAGAGGNDLLQGREGGDTLTGGLGADTLVGGAGADNLTGGVGADVFRFSSLGDSNTAGGVDLVTDFKAANGDIVDLSGIDAIASTTADDAFHFVTAFGGHAGEAVLAFNAASNLTTLTLDVNGDRAADFQAVFSGHPTSDAGWML